MTNVLQNLRSTEPSFDTWYKSVQEQLAADPLMKFFYELRTRILKQGDSGVGGYAHIKSFQFPLDMKKFGPPPPNAKNFSLAIRLVAQVGKSKSLQETWKSTTSICRLKLVRQDYTSAMRPVSPRTRNQPTLM